MAQQIYDAYNSRKMSSDWAKWANENEDAAALLAQVEKMTNE